MLLKMVDARTAVVVAHPGLDFGGREGASRLDDGLLAVHPTRLDRVEPRALARQSALENPHPTLALDSPVVLANPGPDRLADMPARVVPEQHEHALVVLGERLDHPGQERDRYQTDRAAVDKPQQHLGRVGPQHPIAGQCLRLRIGLVSRLCDQMQRLLAPGTQRWVGQARPPDFVLEPDDPILVSLRQPHQSVASFFFLTYAGSGLVIHFLARFHPMPSRVIAPRTVSSDMRAEVSPRSKQTSAASSSVHTEVGLPKSRGDWCSRARNCSLRSWSKVLAALFGRRDCIRSAATPRCSNAGRMLSTAWTEQPTDWAIWLALWPRELASTIWQRRTVNACEER